MEELSGSVSVSFGSRVGGVVGVAGEAGLFLEREGSGFIKLGIFGNSSSF